MMAKTASTTELPGEPIGVPGPITILCLVLTFGWLGSSGEHMALAWAHTELYDSLGPVREDWHGGTHSTGT